MRTRPRMAYETVGGKPLAPEEGKRLVLLASERLRQREQERAIERAKEPQIPEPSPLAKRLQRLTDDVEEKIVEAVWTERCLPGAGGGGQCGLSYFHENSEKFANAVAEGGWRQKEYGSPPPKAIDAMPIALGWLSYLDRTNADLVHSAAGSKRGNVDANVAWGEVKSRCSELREFPVRALQRRYEEALMKIMMKVTFG